MEPAPLSMSTAQYSPSEVKELFEYLFNDRYHPSQGETIPSKGPRRWTLDLIGMLYIPVLTLLFFILDKLNIFQEQPLILYCGVIVIFFVLYLIANELIERSFVRKVSVNDSEAHLIQERLAHSLYHRNHQQILLALILFLVEPNLLIFPLVIVLIGFLRMLYYSVRFHSHLTVLYKNIQTVDNFFPYPARFSTVYPVSNKHFLLTTGFVERYFNRTSQAMLEPLRLFFRYPGKPTQSGRLMHVVFVQMFCPFAIMGAIYLLLGSTTADDPFFTLLLSFVLFFPTVTLAGFLIDLRMYKVISQKITELQQIVNDEKVGELVQLLEILDYDKFEGSTIIHRLYSYYLGLAVPTRPINDWIQRIRQEK